ncbi:phage tail tape measure protein [Streptomyces buecherae]|uniref:Phage tail tape measure protein n=1 Tax=Streptomyces buecherae TaxID=2763006 RepID=A0A7H8NB45_9ACTN|nr:phage tail tape measure protein [Streptomyces buecherae]QKW51685.1 phage tail tape measure protein [Streptomyces buecherae]
MALMVGELAATITVDDSGAIAGVRRAEATMQAGGDRITATADRAGQQAGDALGDGLADGAADGADAAAGGMETALRGMAAAAIGAAIGGALMAGIGQALEQSAVPGQLQAQLGATGPVAAQYGKAAGALYAGAIVDSVADGAEVLKGIAQNGLLPPEATQGQVRQMGRRVADTAAVMGEDVGKVSRAVGVMLKSGIAKNADEAMNVLVKGAQKGVNSAEDLLDTFTEYPIQFRDLGIDAKTAMGLMQQGLQGGARDADTVADALKEFAIRSKDMSEGSVQAFKDIGLNADQMAATFTKGGPEASKALGDVLKRVKAIEDPAKRNATAVALFGTKAEDLQSALFKLDPTTAVQALGDVKGATDKAGDAMRNNAAAKFEMFKRGVNQKIVGVLTTYAIPALMKGAEYGLAFGRAMGTAGAFVARHSTAFTVAAGVITLVMLPTLVRLAVQSAVTTGAVVTGWATQGAASVAAGGRFAVANALMLAGWVRQGAAATATAARVVAAWVLMGAQSMIQAARMAAAWLIAMGPIALVVAAVVGVVAAVIANWGKIKSATSAAWNWIQSKVTGAARFMLNAFLSWTIVGTIVKHWNAAKAGTVRVWNASVAFVRSVPGRMLGFFLNWTIAGLIARHWQSAKDATARKGVEMVTWVRGLPGRISRSIGNLGGLLTGAGRDVVRGMWTGIQSMGGWLKSKLTSWAKDAVPGPIKKALKIFSPSRVMAELGRFAGQGLVQGLTGTTPQVAAASKKVADYIRRAFQEETSAQITRDRKALARLAGQRGRAAARERARLRRDIAAQQRIQRAGDPLAKRIAKGNALLAAAAKKRDQVAGKLKAAEDKLKGLQQEWTQTRDQVAGGIVQAANITRAMGGGVDVSAESILERLAGDVQKAKLFDTRLDKLRKKGLAGALIEQIAQAGVEGGSATAAALVAATPEQIKAMNQQQAALTAAAKAAGGTTADVMYGSGIAAAKGLVAGLKSQQRAIEMQMLAIAKGMQGAIRQALKIKSPSRVMAALGRFIPAGLVAGIKAGAPAVDRTMRRLVPVPPAPAPTPAGRTTAAATSSISAGVHIEHWHAGSATADQTAYALAWHAKARG